MNRTDGTVTTDVFFATTFSNEKPLLQSAYVVRREAMFSQVSVCLSILGVGYPSPRFFSRFLVPGPFSGGTPVSGPMSFAGDTPISGPTMSFLARTGLGYPPGTGYATGSMPLAISCRRTFL